MATRMFLRHSGLPSPYCTARNKRRMTTAEHQIDECIMGLQSLHRCKESKMPKIKAMIMMTTSRRYRFLNWPDDIYIYSYQRKFPSFLVFTLLYNWTSLWIRGWWRKSDVFIFWSLSTRQRLNKNIFLIKNHSIYSLVSYFCHPLSE